MPSASMDPESGAGGAVTDTSVHRKSRRKLTVAHVPQELVDSTQLSDADRRLAEMGYIQVVLRSLLPPFLLYRPNKKEHVTVMRQMGS